LSPLSNAPTAGGHHADEDQDEEGGAAAGGAGPEVLQGSDEMGQLLLVTSKHKLKSFAFCPVAVKGCLGQVALGLANNSVEVRCGFVITRYIPCGCFAVEVCVRSCYDLLVSVMICSITQDEVPSTEAHEILASLTTLLFISDIVVCLPSLRHLLIY
jgi:hypothetical protein